MSDTSIPPWLQEQLAKYEQLRQTLQSVLAQKQQLDAEFADIQRALEELKKATADTPIYKFAGSIMIRVNKEDIEKDLEEKKELTSTRITVLAKQEERLRANMQELQNKVTEALKPKQPPS
ncbi:MAG: prefoldin subunit beta [Conexivisphaerales archaeon]